MGSVYASCRDCGESIGGYWSSEVDDEDSDEPFNLKLKRIAHKSECCGTLKMQRALDYLQSRVKDYPILEILLKQAREQ